MTPEEAAAAERVKTALADYDRRRNMPRNSGKMPPSARVEFSVPIKTANPLNGSWGHPMVQAKKRQKERMAVYACMPPIELTPVLRVTLTRYSSGELDPDGLYASLKSVVDAIAQRLRVDDRCGLVDWQRRQAKGARGEARVHVEIEAPWTKAAATEVEQATTTAAIKENGEQQ